MKWTIPLIALSLLLLTACNQPAKPTKDSNMKTFAMSSKPYARYWWFASMIKEEDVRYNLDWLKAHGFGGVEVLGGVELSEVSDSGRVRRRRPGGGGIGGFPDRPVDLGASRGERQSPSHHD